MKEPKQAEFVNMRVCVKDENVACDIEDNHEIYCPVCIHTCETIQQAKFIPQFGFVC